MAEYLIAVLAACSAAALVCWAAGRFSSDGHGIAVRLATLEPPDGTRTGPRGAAHRSVSHRLSALLQRLGRMAPDSIDVEPLRRELVHAGFRGAAAPRVYLGARLAVVLAALASIPLFVAFMGPAGWLAAPGTLLIAWLAPAFYLGHRTRGRRAQMQKAIPDMLDALVVSMEAGLGLFQALLRVSEQSRQMCPPLSAEMALANVEMRTGAPRDEALRDLAERVGLPEMRSLVSALIQTDRFGTSVTQALRVQADTLREKRRQRAEEAAAKTTVKMIFPLVLFIFPSLFVVTLGPAVVQVVAMLSK